MERKNYFLKIIIGVIFLVNIPQISFSQSTTPFNCDYYAYLFQFNDVYSIDLASGNAILQAEDITEGKINAAGYNNKDGYIWGSLSTPDRSIVRIGKDFKTDIYEVPELPAAGRYIGDIDSNGMYYLKPGGTTVYKVNLDPNSPNYLKSAGTITLDTNIHIHDWAFNAKDNALYTVEKSTNILYRIDIEAGEVTALGEVPILSGNKYTYGAVYFDADGNFYISANQTGTIYIVYAVQDLTGSNEMSSNFFAFGPASSSNDGARCPTAPVAQENCSNGIDDDGDGLVDCDDLSCSGVGSCEVNTDASGGNDGGLESNNRLSQKIVSRNYKRQKSNYKFIKENAKQLQRLSTYKKAKSATTIKLNDFIPVDLLTNTTTIESTPTDLLNITNANEILSVDYLRNSKTVAAILATKTTKGAYEHTKYICDRLLGAEILSVSTMYLKEEYPFIKTLIKHPNGEREYVISFSIKENGSNKYIVDSHWNLDRYDKTSDYYNFQVWSNSIDDLYNLSEEILELIEVQKPIESYNTTLAPTAYIKKGTYKDGKLNLKIVNIKEHATVNFVGEIRKSETSNGVALSQSINLTKDYISDVQLDTGYLFDVGLRMHSNGKDTPDDLFMSDGAWGVDDSPKSSVVSNFTVTPHTPVNESNILMLERNVSLTANTSEFVAVYKSFTPTFQPVDLSAFNMLKFNASGTGKLEVRFMKKDTPNWQDQYRMEVDLTATDTQFTIPFKDFMAKGSTDFDGKDIVTVIFSLKATSQQVEEKKLDISNIYFKNGEVLSVDDELLNSNAKVKVTVSPNPMNLSSTLSFVADTRSSTHIVVYNSLGMLVKQTSINAKVGKNEWVLTRENLKSGLYFVKIQSQHRKYQTTKVLIK